MSTFSRLTFLINPNPLLLPRIKPTNPGAAAGLITPKNAPILYWTLLPISWAVSWVYNITYVGLLFSVASFLYNDLEYSRFWWSKNVLNVVGYACFDWGATTLGSGLDASDTLMHVHALNALIILTTIHAQDFYDKIGDQLGGRQTIPTQWPETWARVSVVFSIEIWTFFIATYARMWIVKIVFMVLGLSLSRRFWMLRDYVNDHRSLELYMIWLTMARVILIMFSEA